MAADLSLIGISPWDVWDHARLGERGTEQSLETPMLNTDDGECKCANKLTQTEMIQL